MTLSWKPLREVMFRQSFLIMRFEPIVFALVTVLWRAPNALAAAPAGAMNKSVEIGWQEDRTDKVKWSGKVNNILIQTKLTVYISSRGKVFSEMNRNGNLVRQAGDEQPQGNNSNRTWKIKNWHFEGRALVGLQEFGPNGARRLAIEFDDSFRGCRATIQSGRSSAANMVGKYLDSGQEFEVLSEKIEPATCSVREGNPFN